MSVNERQEHIKGICRDILAGKDSRIWKDYVNALNLVSDVVFTRSTGFLFELIQNAEDAGFGQEEPVQFSVDISKSRIKVVHNAAPFQPNDVEALCGIRSSKKPERGTLGYLGIGFKSVLMVTDVPEVYSGGYQFKFDRNAWPEPEDTPWHVMPLWIDTPSEVVDREKTTLILPLREDDKDISASALKDDLGKLQESLFLFLKHMNKVTATADSEQEPFLVLESFGDKSGTTVLSRNGVKRRFLLRRKVVDVPEDVVTDRLTRKYRKNVTKREIVIGFALDDSGSLAPTEAGAMHGGVYSFQPVGESKSGAKFPIQADFLVQPGRDALNHEAKWNRWLVDELATLCKETLTEFAQHPKWKYQFLPVFDFAHNEGLEAYESLFRGHLIEPVEVHIRTSKIIPTADGAVAKLDDVVRMDESDDAAKALVEMGLFDAAELASSLGGRKDLRFVHAQVVDADGYAIRKVARQDLLKNATLLTMKAGADGAAQWFSKLYLWLSRHPVYYDYFYRKPRKGISGYHNYPIVLTADHKVRRGGSEDNDGGVRFLDIDRKDEMARGLAQRLAQTKPMLHPDVLIAANQQEVDEVKGFLTGLAGVRELSAPDVCREMLLPTMLTSAPAPSAEDLVRHSQYCQRVLGTGLGDGCELWVVDKQNAVRPAREVFMSTIFQPDLDWEANARYLPGLHFVSGAYLAEHPTSEELGAWRRFFSAAGVKAEPANGTRDFGERYAKVELKSMVEKQLGITLPENDVASVDGQQYGYDVQIALPGGGEMCVEVKGHSVGKDVDIVLTPRESKSSMEKKQDFFLLSVSGIPNAPEGRLLRDPWGRTDTNKDVVLSIPLGVWRLGDKV